MTEWHKAYLRDVAVACESCLGCCLSSAPLEGSICMPSPCCCRKLASTAAVAVLLLLCCEVSVLLLLLCTFAALLLVLWSVAEAVMLVLKAGLGSYRGEVWRGNARGVTGEDSGISACRQQETLVELERSSSSCSDGS